MYNTITETIGEAIVRWEVLIATLVAFFVFQRISNKNRRWHNVTIYGKSEIVFNAHCLWCNKINNSSKY